MSRYHRKIRDTATVIIIVLFILTILFTAGCVNKRQYGTGDIITGIWILKVDADGNKQWTTIIDGDPKITGAAIIQTFDGGYAVAGTEGQTSRIFTFDAGGEAVSDIATDTKQEWGLSLVEAPGGGYVFAGHLGVLTRMDVRGNALWNNTPIGDGSERGPRLVLVRAPDGGYAVVGNNQSVRLDENGMTLWEAAFAPDESVSTIIASPTGGFVTGGTCSEGAWVTMLDSEGDRVWNRTFPNELSASLYIVRLSPAGTYDLIYATEQVTRGQEVSWVTETTEVSLSAKGELIMERPVQASPFIVATEDGGYAYAGYSNPQYNQLHESGHRGTPLQVVRLDNDGAVTWDKSFNIGNYRYVTSIIQTADGGFAIFGNSIYF